MRPSIHRSAWKRISRKFRYEILHTVALYDRLHRPRPGPKHRSQHYILGHWINMRECGCSEAASGRSYRARTAGERMVIPPGILRPAEGHGVGERLAA